MIVVFLGQCYWKFLNLGPFGLTIIVVLLESYLQNPGKHSIELAVAFGNSSESFPHYVDDSHA